jgi:hypothetical protein
MSHNSHKMSIYQLKLVRAFPFSTRSNHLPSFLFRYSWGIWRALKFWEGASKEGGIWWAVGFSGKNVFWLLAILMEFYKETVVSVDCLHITVLTLRYFIRLSRYCTIFHHSSDRVCSALVVLWHQKVAWVAVGASGKEVSGGRLSFGRETSGEGGAYGEKRGYCAWNHSYCNEVDIWPWMKWK